MFHCMNLVDCIFGICLLVSFFCYVWFYFSQSVFSKVLPLLFIKEVAIGPARVMWLE